MVESSGHEIVQRTVNTNRAGEHYARRARSSLREVAEPAHIDPAHLSRVERGKRNLSLPATLRLARALGLRDLVRELENIGVDPGDDDPGT